MSRRARILVLGASGMLGHKLAARLAAEFPVAGTIRDREPPEALTRLLPGIRIYPNVSADDIATIRHAMADWRGSVVVNCIGIVKQAKAASEPLPSIRINALLPHELHRLAAERGARLIHISTDCVFSGRHGPYSEADPPDPEDLYGRTKLLGEVSGGGALTLRTSLIGREIGEVHYGLIEWFLAERGKRVRGYDRALFSGLTTLAASDLIAKIITGYEHLDGILHASAKPISKYDLLQLVNRIYGLGVEIDRDDTVAIDRRLDGTLLRRCAGWCPPSWDEMITAMRAEDAMYDTVPQC
jgi:dTDP-4-dehydrorhamnose reductase